MSKENAPAKWKEIVAAAKDCGASDWAIRKWLARREVPPGWKLKIIERTRGRVSLKDMLIKPRSEGDSREKDFERRVEAG